MGIPGEIDNERERADKLAAKLDTSIPGYIYVAFWAIPLLEVIVERLESLEKRVEQLERAVK